MNSVNLIGRLTRDPEPRATPRGTDVCVLRVAIERAGEGADYVDVVAFGALARSCGEYLVKGRQVGVAGRLAYRQWEKAGERRSKHEVIAQSVAFLGQTREADCRGGREAGRAPVPPRITA